MTAAARYAVISTEWGFFALAALENALAATILPRPTPSEAEKLLLARLPEATPDNSLLKALQKQIIAYFQGRSLQFDPDIPLYLDELTDFTASILTACRRIPPGRTATYGSLAVDAGRPTAARAVGRAMATNPMPLIIPCHRVIAANGRLCGFSAKGGVSLKKKLLQHEQNAAESAICTS